MLARRIARGKALNAAAHRGVKNSALLAREAGEIFSQMGDSFRLDWAIAMLWSGEMDLLEVLSIFREIGDRFYLTCALWALFMAAIWEGDLLHGQTVSGRKPGFEPRDWVFGRRRYGPDRFGLDTIYVRRSHTGTKDVHNPPVKIIKQQAPLEKMIFHFL